MNRVFLLVLALLGPITGFTQSDCKVYPSAISEFYVGDCKKGLAHGMGKAEGVDMYEGEFKKGYPQGEGVYTFKNGSVYRGHFDKGMKHGKGELTFKVHGKDSVTVGYWREDKYIGLTNEPPYRVLEKTSIERYTFSHEDSDENEVTLMFFQGGVRNNGMSNVIIQNTSGTYRTEGVSWVRFSNIELPFQGKVTYQTLNKAKSISIYCSFSFKISQEGKWNVRVTNQ